jgi:hypothetical protein
MMTAELAKWLIGAIVGGAVTIVGAVVWLQVLVFRIGQKYGAVESKLEELDAAIEKLDKAGEKLARVDVIETKLAQLIESHAEERRRFASEWPELKSRVDVLWERVVSLADWRKSRPQFGK